MMGKCRFVKDICIGVITSATSVIGTWMEVMREVKAMFEACSGGNRNWISALGQLVKRRGEVVLENIIG